ncbi:cytochrome c biogenesis heme-transporting ATPase CcmA [Methyloversatilis thermotolerans]|uniref:cytochrome c biogenesis heme-transporting ATPase CcmA n=1 Tax=Methyloversatilis thermotolerans TaxID=1346290 RepID=UPI0003748FA5|nr:cytochrome c biogenesis heme-transporting ATPase CcmA [Methyloversatilis thermotolerans]
MADAADTPMLSARALSCARGRVRLFAGLDLAVRPGELLQVAGGNGTGKTSLLRILCGLSEAEAGELMWRARPVREVRDDWKAGLLYLGHRNAVKDDFTPLENLRFSAAIAGEALDADRALRALVDIGLRTRLDVATRNLSQGQRRRVALARLLCGTRAALWLLDEPFTALDAAAVAQLAGAIAAHVRGGGAVIYTTHQPVDIDVPTRACVNLDDYAC